MIRLCADRDNQHNPLDDGKLPTFRGRCGHEESAKLAKACVESVVTASRAAFLSYASEDAAAAERIVIALRAAGTEVFLDQSELRGGDACDRKMRREGRDCALFLPRLSPTAPPRPARDLH